MIYGEKMSNFLFERSPLIGKFVDNDGQGTGDNKKQTDDLADFDLVDCPGVKTEEFGGKADDAVADEVKTDLVVVAFAQN